jgi:hypothetical protein
LLLSRRLPDRPRLECLTSLPPCGQVLLPKDTRDSGGVGLL